MQIVIDIPNPPKEQSIINVPIHFCDGQVVDAGGYGFEVLPKRHGALKDADAIWESMKNHRYSDGFCVAHDIDYSINLEMSGIVLRDAPTIIEADKEVEDDIAENEAVQ